MGWINCCSTELLAYTTLKTFQKPNFCCTFLFMQIISLFRLRLSGDCSTTSLGCTVKSCGMQSNRMFEHSQQTSTERSRMWWNKMDGVAAAPLWLPW